jgi:hypothetical protein
MRFAGGAKCRNVELRRRKIGGGLDYTGSPSRPLATGPRGPAARETLSYAIVEREFSSSKPNCFRLKQAAANKRTSKPEPVRAAELASEIGVAVKLTLSKSTWGPPAERIIERSPVGKVEPLLNVHVSSANPPAGVTELLDELKEHSWVEPASRAMVYVPFNPSRRFPIKTDNVYVVSASSELVKVCEIVPPLLNATMLPFGKGKFKNVELGSNKPPTPVIVQSGIGPKLKAQVPGPVQVNGKELGVSKDAF